MQRVCTTIDKRFLVPKIYPGSIVKNSGTYRYRSGRRGRRGRGLDYPFGRYRRATAETGTFRASTRTTPSSSSRTNSFFFRFARFFPLFCFSFLVKNRKFSVDARGRANSSITYYRNERSRTWRIMPGAICRVVFTVPHSRRGHQTRNFCQFKPRIPRSNSGTVNGTDSVR